MRPPNVTMFAQGFMLDAIGLTYGVPPLIVHCIQLLLRVIGLMFAPNYNEYYHFIIRRHIVCLEKSIHSAARSGDKWANAIEEVLMRTTNQRNLLPNVDFTYRLNGPGRKYLGLSFESFHRVCVSFCKNTYDFTFVFSHSQVARRHMRYYNFRWADRVLVDSLRRTRFVRMDEFAKLGMRKEDGSFIYGRDYRMEESQLFFDERKLSTANSIFRDDLRKS